MRTIRRCNISSTILLKFWTRCFRIPSAQTNPFTWARLQSIVWSPHWLGQQTQIVFELQFFILQNKIKTRPKSSFLCLKTVFSSFLNMLDCALLHSTEIFFFRFCVSFLILMFRRITTRDNCRNSSLKSIHPFWKALVHYNSNIRIQNRKNRMCRNNKKCKCLVVQNVDFL